MHMQGFEPNSEWLFEFESPVVRLWGRTPLPKSHLIYNHPRAVVLQDKMLPSLSCPTTTVWSLPLDAERVITQGLKRGTTIENVPTTENPQDVFFCEPFLDIYPDDSQLTTNEVAEAYPIAQTSEEYCKTEPNEDLDFLAPSMWFAELDDSLSDSIWDIPLPDISLPFSFQERQGTASQPNNIEYEGSPASRLTWPEERLVPSTMATQSLLSSSKRKYDDSVNISTHEHNRIVPDDLLHQSLPFFPAQHPACTVTSSSGGTGASSSPSTYMHSNLKADSKATPPAHLSQPTFSGGPSRIKRRRMPSTNPWLARNRSPSNPLAVSSASTAAPAFTMGLMDFTIDFSYTNNTPADAARFLRQYNRARDRNMKAGAREGRGRGLQRRLSLIS